MKPLFLLPSAHRAVPFWTCCLLVASCESQAQIVGKVVDGMGRPLEGVSVRVIGSGFQTTTDQAGAYRLDYVPGTFQVGVSKDQHTSASLPLSLSVKDRYPAESAILYRLPTRPGIAYFDDSCFVNLTKHTGISWDEEKPTTIGVDFTRTLRSTRYIVGRKVRGVGLPSPATGGFIDNSPRRNALFRVADNGVFLTRDQSLTNTADKMDSVPLTASQIAPGVYLRKPAVPLRVGKYAFATLSEDTRAPLGWREPSLNTDAPIGPPLYLFEVFDPADRHPGKIGQLQQLEDVSGTWIGDDAWPPMFLKIGSNRELSMYNGCELIQAKLAKDAASGELLFEFQIDGTMHSAKIQRDRELLWVESVEGGTSSFRRYFGNLPKFKTIFNIDANKRDSPLTIGDLNTVTALRIALSDYHFEYLAYPLPQRQGEADVMIAADALLTNALGAGQDSAPGTRDNPKGINFLKDASGITARDMKSEGDGYHLRDYWGNHFFIGVQH